MGRQGSFLPLLQFRPLHNRRGPQEARDGFLGVDALPVVDVAVVARLDANAVAGAVNVDEALVVDFGVLGDALAGCYDTWIRDYTVSTAVCRLFALCKDRFRSLS